MSDDTKNIITELFHTLNGDDKLKRIISLAKNLDDRTITKIFRSFHVKSTGLTLDNIDAKVDVTITNALESYDYTNDHDICGRACTCKK